MAKMSISKTDGEVMRAAVPPETVHPRMPRMIHSSRRSKAAAGVTRPTGSCGPRRDRRRDTEYQGKTRQRANYRLKPTLMMRWLIPRMPQFHSAHPAAEVRLLAGGGPVTLGSGIDLAIRRNVFTWPDTFFSRHLFDEKIGRVYRPSSLRRPLPRKDLGKGKTHARSDVGNSSGSMFRMSSAIRPVRPQFAT